MKIIKEEFLDILWDILSCEYPELSFDLFSDHEKLINLTNSLVNSQKNFELKIVQFIVKRAKSMWNLHLLSTFYDKLLPPSVEKLYLDHIHEENFEGNYLFYMESLDLKEFIY